MQELYFPGLTDEPFQNSKEQMRAWFRFLDLLAYLGYEVDAGRIATLFSTDSITDLIEPGQEKTPYWGVSELRGLFDRLVQKGMYREVPLFPLSRLMLGLYPVQFLAVLLALASASDRKYERVFGPMMEEKNELFHPTVGLCLDLARFFLTEEERDARYLLAEDEFINRFCLITEKKQLYPELSRPLALRPLALELLLDGEESLGALAQCAYVPAPHRVEEDVHSTARRELREMLSNVVSGEAFSERDRTVIELSGDDGIGKRTLAASVAGEFGLSVCCVDVNRLLFLEDEGQESCIRDLVLLCALGERIPYLCNMNDSPPLEYAALVARLQRDITLLLVGTEKPHPRGVTRSFAGTVYRLSLDEVSTPQQKLLWKRMGEEQGLIYGEDISLDEIVSKYTMNPGRIREVVENARLVTQPSGEGVVISAPVLERQIRRASCVDFGDNATLLRSPFTWEDLMISENGEKLLRMAADRVRFRSVVNEDYGFGAKLPYGRGVSIVFYGPPGTGKTMAAQVLANDLGLDIYRIDLSQVSSKYIGETEKNLGAVFEAARNSNAILFFDEADSLFAKRTDVSSSNDKHANAQTSYLLQKIEEYSGVSVLATNNLQNFDAAFKRRMTYLIPIEAPDEETRLRLWEAVFPADVPLEERVDLGLLAREVKLTGSAIKSAAVAAAYRAAAKGKPVGYDELVESIDLECVKVGELGVGARLTQAVMIDM